MKLSSPLPIAPRRFRSRIALGAVAIFAFALAACSSDSGGDSIEDGLDQAGSNLTQLTPETDDDLAHTPWETIGAGVSYKQFGDGADVLIVYGGYTAKDEFVQRWTDELVRQKLGAQGVGHIYAVKGPNQAGYANKEIGNSKLAAHLAANGRADGATNIIVVSHSSGTYVADEFFEDAQAGRAGDGTLGKITLYNLDGGGVSASLLAGMAHAYWVYGCDSTIGRCSHNYQFMKDEGATYKKYGGPIEVDATGSGCDAHADGGAWCMHDTLITNKPHNKVMYDLGDDYTDFHGSRSVVTSYFDGP
jgi:hypothetical protein